MGGRRRPRVRSVTALGLRAAALAAVTMGSLGCLATSAPPGSPASTRAESVPSRTDLDLPDPPSASASPAPPIPATRPPAGVALAYPDGCTAYALSPRRCQFIVDWAIADAGLLGQPATVQLLGDPACDNQPAPCTGVARTMAFVVRVRLIPLSGAPSDHPVFCGVGGERTMLCSETPRIIVRTPMDSYHDLPCNGEGGAGGTCASSVPSIDPRDFASAVPLQVPSITIHVERTGEYLLDLGNAVLPNGVLSVATATLSHDRRTDVLISQGIALEVIGANGRPLENAYAQGWRRGTERVHVQLQFTVDSFDPGATLELTQIVVR